MIWEKIEGRAQLVQTLQTAIQTGHVVHAYLFYGPVGIGKKTIAQVFAAALNCHNKDRACGQCPSCRHAFGGLHPDIHWIMPEGKTLKIEQIRAMKKYAYLQPRLGRYQIFILVHAETMTTEAANSLLVVLEEAPAASIFILLAEQPALLPATVLSRCQLMAVPRLDTDTMTNFIQKTAHVTSEELAIILDAAEGIPGRALEGLKKRNWLLQHEQAVQILVEADNGEQISRLAARLAESEELDVLLDTILLVLRDLLLWQTVGKLAQGRLERINSLLPIWNANQCINAIQIIIAWQQKLQSPINIRLALENLLMCLKEVGLDANCGGNPL